MKQPQLIKDAFKKKKFKTGNQDRIKEAVRDCAKLCGMAAVCEFLHSDFYPSPTDRAANLRKNFFFCFLLQLQKRKKDKSN